MRSRVHLPLGVAVSVVLALAGVVPAPVASAAVDSAAPAHAAHAGSPAAPTSSAAPSRSSAAAKAAKPARPVRLSSPAAVKGAFAVQGANACTWTVGSPGIEKTFTFDGSSGNYLMTSFKNTLVRPAQQYVTAGAPSAEFRFNWDGVTLTGASGGWSCRSGQAQRVDVGGAPALQLDVSLSRQSVRVTKHYVIYPRVALIREWTDYLNTGKAAHELAQPSFLEQQVMGDSVADTDLNYMDGAYQYTLETTPLTADYARTFDSYGDDGTFHETTNLYEPWFTLFDRKTRDGLYSGFDYFGRWSMTVGQRDGSGINLSLQIPNYDSPVRPGQVVTSPKAFDAVYKTDLDDMTNRLLDWQYTYMWDYTRSPYFTAVRDEGPSYATGVGDNAGLLQFVMGQTETMRSIGVDTYHRDWGWWDTEGNWNGPDWRLTHDYLAQSGMAQIIYYSAYLATDISQVGQDHPEWFLPNKFCGNGSLFNLGIPAAKAWMQNLLIDNAQKWGDYEWRNDACPMGDWTGAEQLAQDQGFRSVLQGFLDARPGSGFHGVSQGGNEFGFDWLRFADGTSMTDANGYNQQYGGTMLYPVDKLSGVPEAWRADGGGSDIGAACDPIFNTQLMWNPDLQGDTNDPAALECIRKIIDIYHYLVAQGVAGRWVQQYHPHGTDADMNWFERLSGDSQRGLIIYKGGASADPVTVFPKGLDPQRTYDVRFQFAPGSSVRTGASLMSSGITLPSIGVGELIYLNLPGHPGSGTDHSAPSAPSAVRVTTGTNMGYGGVEVRWAPAHDNNWISYYDVLRDGKMLGKVAKGTFYFDHTAGASVSAVYAVRAVDGDGNASPLASTAGGAAETVAADDSSPAITYTGDWHHDSGLPGPAEGTQSDASGLLCHTACLEFSGTQGAGGWGYQDGPAPLCPQACQQFSGTQGTGNWSYQDGPGAVPLPCHLACQDFSYLQGANGWSYQTNTGGAWADITGYNSLGLAGECCAWYDFGRSGDFSGLVSPRFLLPGVGHDTARVWTAPKDGVVDISAQAIPYVPGNTSVLTITQNGQPVWGPQALDGSGAALDTSVANLAVGAGDVVRFEVQSEKFLNIRSLTQWDPDVHYQGDPPVPSAGPPPAGWLNMPAYAYHGGEDFLGDGPFWRNVGGQVSARLLQPGNSQDVARVWTAPRDGVVDVTGHVAKDAADSSGPDTTVSITDNGQVIWGPQTIAGNDTTGVDTAVGGVAVSAGDVIRFQVAAGGGVVMWAPDVTYQGDPPTVVPVPAWTDMTTFHADGDFTGNGGSSGDGPYWHDAAGYVSANLLQPSIQQDVARTWTAPADGVIDIGGHASGGAMVSITRNRQVIWGPQAANDIDTSVSGVTVSAGDVIRFQVAANGPVTRWDQDVSYSGSQPPAPDPGTASWTFTGSQVTWYAQLGFEWGLAQVLIDGKPDATIDLYAPNLTNCSVPVYTKTFPAVGTHTITVRAADRADPLNGAGAIHVNVDGFQALTTAPAVTQEKGPAIALTGPGWAKQAAAPASGGAIAASSRAGDTASFHFTGKSVTWVGRICPSCGEADVYIDGSYVTRIDTFGFRGPQVWQAAMFQQSWAAAGRHTLTIVVDGTKNFISAGAEVDIDSFQVRPG